MGRRSSLILGMAMLLVSCSSEPKSSQPSPTASTNASPSTQTGVAFGNPVVNPSATVEVARVPGLLQPTNARLRVPTIAAGRSDPFAVVLAGPISAPPQRIVAAAPTQPSRQVSKLNVSPIPASPLPQSFTPRSLPPLPPISQGSSPLVPIPVAPVSPTSIADAIEVTGAVQVRDKWQIIVKEPDVNTSRYVTIGDSLANGRVLVKRVIAGADPMVILQQDGKEVMKSIGAPSLASNL